MRRAAIVLFALLSGSLVAAAPGRASTPLTFHDGNGLRVVSVTQIDGRQYDVAVWPQALQRTVHVRLLIPADYAATKDRLPVLYLFHGTSGRASDWVTQGNAEQATAALRLIVVMPDAGFDGDGGGWFTDWVDTSTALGPSRWETFHIDELIPWVDRNLRTVANRRGRAIAGLSQGGFGSTTYAARHPDEFISAASFSGAPDIDYSPPIAAGATVVIEGTALGLDGVQPEAMFGPRSTDEINWQGHDPADLVGNLRPVDLWLYTANGQPGPLDSGPPNPEASGIELATHESTDSFAQHAGQEGVEYHLVDYGAGTHTWPYWARDLTWYLPQAMEAFRGSAAGPRRIDYQSVDATWSQWGWSVTIRRTAAQEFSALSGAGPAGFTLQGTGAATVTTPPYYRPGSRHTVNISGEPATTQSADSHGRLRVAVPLGPDTAPPAAIGAPAVPGQPVTVSIG